MTCSIPPHSLIDAIASIAALMNAGENPDFVAVSRAGSEASLVASVRMIRSPSKRSEPFVMRARSCRSTNTRPWLRMTVACPWWPCTDNASLSRCDCAIAIDTIKSNAPNIIGLCFIMWNIDYSLDESCVEQVCLRLSRFHRLVCLLDVLCLREGRKRGLHLHVDQQVNATLQLKELRHRQRRKNFVELFEIPLFQSRQTRVVVEHSFRHRFGLRITQVWVLLGVLLDDADAA